MQKKNLPFAKRGKIIFGNTIAVSQKPPKSPKLAFFADLLYNIGAKFRYVNSHF